MQVSAQMLNADGGSALLDRNALQRAMQAQGEAWQSMVNERSPHMFADAPLFITSLQMRQMRAVIDAVERVVALPAWRECFVPDHAAHARGVFFGYDFHLNEQGAHLIEINTNAGGGFLNALLYDSQRAAGWPGEVQAQENLEQVFLEMFRNEWRMVRGDAPLNSIAIVDESPDEQYLYSEFLLAQRIFERAGMEVYIADPVDLRTCSRSLYVDGRKIDLLYNRLTDFSLQQYPVLRLAYLDGGVVLTPDPAHYACYADKRNLARLTDAAGLRALGVDQADIDTLQAGVPHTLLVAGADHEQWWRERKHWFFKPVAGYGSKGSYNGAKLTKRVFEEIMQGGYIAQRIATPGVCMVAGTEPLKYDVRCYVYDGQVQLVAARLYQGQTTNFRTPGGGFAPVYVVG